MTPTDHCIGFSIDCFTLLTGVLAVLAAFTIFIGSIYVLLSAVFGRRMAYLVLMVAFSGWLIIQSSVWVFGFWSQGLETPTNLGPRGSEPAWLPISASLEASSERYPVVRQYPRAPWKVPGEGLAASEQSVTGAVQNFMVEQANEELGKSEGEIGALTSTDFTVQDIRFTVASDGKTNLAAAQAFYNGGGPVVTVALYHDSGAVPRYSWMFFGASILVFAIHVPLLDRAEKKRKEILTGGAAPPWYGPA